MIAAMPFNDKTDVEALARLIAAAERIVFFTGAGISTESGIPDFRSPGTGLWTKLRPIPFQEFVGSEDVRQASWRQWFDGIRTLGSVEPNQGHLSVAQLVDEGRCSTVITQNVDNLFQDAGIPDHQVIELHGNAAYATCLSCGMRYELADLEVQFQEFDRVLSCADCGGIIKSATISFGQAMPETAMQRAQEATESCDLMVVAGSSLTVYPAAGFPEYAKQSGARLAILNREETPLDSIADVVVHREIGPTLSSVVGLPA